MAIFVYRETQFNKLLRKLRKGGGRPALAAKRAEEIRERLLAKKGVQPARTYKLTRHGEARIVGCRKFDLGRGYRLIYLKEGEHIFLSYIGTHNECDLWIKNNRGLQPAMDEESRQTTFEDRHEEPCSSGCEEGQPDSDYDKLFMERIDDRTLRHVFCGLCGDGSYSR